MIGSDLLRCALLAMRAWAAACGWLSAAGLIGAAAAGGMLSMAFELARSAWVARSVPRQELSRANAQLAAGSAISESAAFAITGAVFQWMGGVAALLADAASYLASAWLLRGTREPRHRQEAAGRTADATPSITVAQVIALLVRDRGLRTLSFLEMLVAVASGIAATSYMLFAARDLALPTAALGVVFALGGAGAALGAALAPVSGRRWGSGRTLAWGLAAAACGAALAPPWPALPARCCRRSHCWLGSN